LPLTEPIPPSSGQSAGERLRVAEEIAQDVRDAGRPGCSAGDVLHVLDGGRPGGEPCHCFGTLANEIEERLVGAGLR